MHFHWMTGVTCEFGILLMQFAGETEVADDISVGFSCRSWWRSLFRFASKNNLIIWVKLLLSYVSCSLRDGWRMNGQWGAETHVERMSIMAFRLKIVLAMFLVLLWFTRWQDVWNIYSIVSAFKLLNDSCNLYRNQVFSVFLYHSSHHVLFCRICILN